LEKRDPSFMLQPPPLDNFEIQNALVPSMPDEDNNFGGSLVLDLRIS